MVDRTTRPIVPVVHSDEVEHRRLLAMRASASLPKDGTEGMSAPLALASYATADLPDAALNAGAVAYEITTLDAIVYSDGSAWVEVGTTAAIDAVVTEGSWTPTLQFGGASTGITYATQVGRWVRSGNMVRAWATIVLTAMGSATGDATVAGLPYSASVVSGLTFIGKLGRYTDIDFDTPPMPHCSIESGASVIGLYDSDGSNDDTAQLNEDWFNDTSAFSLSIAYRTG